MESSTMKIRALGLYVVLALAAACAKSPVAPAGVITVTTASLSAPANGAVFANLAQPVTLTITNATVTDGGASVTYTFEVASDGGFANKVVTRDVPQGAGQTSLKLDMLPAGQDYFWHVRTTAGGTVGAFSGVLKFTIGPAIIIQAPALASPAAGATLTSPRPTLTVTNSTHTGPTGAISYKYQIATDSAFNNVVLSATVSEGSGQTSFAVTSNLAYKTTFFWRAMATDTTNNISSSFSAPLTFTTPPDPATISQASGIAAQLGTTLWPGTVPPGSYGHARLGDNWDVQILCHVPTGTCFQSPTIEMLRLFDLLDLGFDPDGAIDWMNGHGYSTIAQWYPPPSKAVIGLAFVYLAARDKVTVNGIWDLVLKAE
jgi:hypothetical protein